VRMHLAERIAWCPRGGSLAGVPLFPQTWLRPGRQQSRVSPHSPYRDGRNLFPILYLVLGRDVGNGI